MWCEVSVSLNYLNISSITELLIRRKPWISTCYFIPVPASCVSLCEDPSLFNPGWRSCIWYSSNRTQEGPTLVFLRPRWRRTGLWPHDGERCLYKSENKFSPWLAWAMAPWGFIVPAKVIRESNCVLYCPRMSSPNWTRVPHPSAHGGVCMKPCSMLRVLASMMHYVHVRVHTRVGVYGLNTYTCVRQKFSAHVVVDIPNFLL